MLLGVDTRSLVGIEGSYIMGAIKRSSLSSELEQFKNGPKGFSVGLNLGDEYFWGRYFGLRSYFTVGYSSVFKNVANANRQASLLDVSLALEPIINFYNSGQSSFGIFGGVDAAYHYWINKHSFVGRDLLTKKHFLDFGARAGISFLVASNHRFEILARLPFAYVASDTARDIPRSINFAASYKYVF